MTPNTYEPAAPPILEGPALKIYGAVGLEWIMTILPFCTEPENMGNPADQTSASRPTVG